MRDAAAKCSGWFRVSIALAFVWMAVATPVGAQKNKDKKKEPSDADSQASLQFTLPTSDSQAIDRAIGEMLGYWQLGDVGSLQKYFAPDVVVVSGAWETPVIGWDNYLKAYQAQRAQVTGARMERSNTYIHVNGTSAWATYQFVYVALAESKVVQVRGHTTLVLNKRADRWVITLDHSSIVDSSLPAPANPADPAEAAKP